jgi:enoyl-CoA hydratase/carnithine racemase
VRDGLAAESFAYSMLLAGPEFARWRAARPVGAPAAEPSPVVRATRDGDLLDVVLSRPHRRNAFDRQVRDELVEALDLALLDPSVHVRLRGDGPSFCSGGDLDEFGTAQDVAGAHLVRLERSAGLRLATLASRTTAVLHGACIGAGIELPSFAGRVVARSDVRIQLPELALGLIPGAGGTVSVPRRVGRWRTAELALSGRVLGAADALAWGLVDAVLGPDDGKGLFVQRNV